MSRTKWRALLILVAFAGVSACSSDGSSAPQASDVSTTAGHVHSSHHGETDQAELRMPDPAGTLTIGSGATSNVSVAASGDVVAVAWYTYDDVERVERTYAATSVDGGATFGSPVVIQQPASEHPQVAVLADGTILVGVLTYELDRLLDPAVETSWPGWPALYRSKDKGATFEKIADLHSVIGDRLLTLNGLPIGMATSPDGQTIVFAWNDRTPAEFVHPGDPVPVAGTNRQPIWASVSTDGGVTFGAPQVAAASTCNCCRLDTFVQGDRAGVAFRAIASVEGDDTRDERSPSLNLADSSGRFGEQVTIHDDNYVLELEGCPDSGPGLAAGTDGVIHAAWWTGASGVSEWRYATTTDGVTFTSPVSLPGEPSVTGSVETAVDSTGGAWVVGSYWGEAGQDLRVWHVPAGGVPEAVESANADITYATEPYDVAGVGSGAGVVWLKNGAVKFLRVG